jgi:hypothetical protein
MPGTGWSACLGLTGRAGIGAAQGVGKPEGPAPQRTGSQANRLAFVDGLHVGQRPDPGAYLPLQVRSAGLAARMCRWRYPAFSSQLSPLATPRLFKRVSRGSGLPLETGEPVAVDVGEPQSHTG